MSVSTNAAARVSGAFSYVCISEAELVMPLHNRRRMPVAAMSRRKRVFVTMLRSTREGGSCALVAFQFSPPFGRSMAKAVTERFLNRDNGSGSLGGRMLKGYQSQGTWF
jgi:hypothetical protein